MTILALDASTRYLSLALAVEDRLYCRDIACDARQNELLMPLVEELCREAGVDAPELEAVACTRGPGSFTGLRIGLSTAKGLALALGVPLFTENTLVCQALAARSAERQPEPCAKPVLSLLDARAGRWFALVYDGAAQTGAGEQCDLVARGLYTTDELLSRLGAFDSLEVIGEGAEKIISLDLLNLPVLTACSVGSRGFARELLQLARRRYTMKEQGDTLDTGLDYMKKSEAEESLEARLAALPLKG